MTNKELIEKLQKLPQDVEVFVLCGDSTPVSAMYDHEENYIVIE